MNRSSGLFAASYLQDLILAATLVTLAEAVAALKYGNVIALICFYYGFSEADGL